MLCCHTRGEAVGSTEGDVAGLNATRHVVCLARGVDDLINGLHGEVEGHELAHRMQARQCRAHRETAESRFSDRTVDDSLVAEAI